MYFFLKSLAFKSNLFCSLIKAIHARFKMAVVAREANFANGISNHCGIII